MDFKDRRVLIIGGGAVAAIVAALALAAVFGGGDKKTSDERPPAAEGGLQVDVAETPTLDPARALRCYVDGRYVGEATLEDCARRNGVATGALDVGVDESGEWTAAETASLAPPPEAPPLEVAPSPEIVDASGDTSAAPVAEDQPSGECLRFIGGEWRRLSENIGLNACVQILFQGRCERPGSASYGRWAGTTLRLVPGRVEQSDNNREFKLYVEQGGGCSIPPR